MKKHIAHTVLEQSKSRTDFYKRLAYLDLYICRTRTGLSIEEGSTGKKHSFQSLSITEKDLNILDQKAELCQMKDRLCRLEQIQNRGKERNKELER